MQRIHVTKAKWKMLMQLANLATDCGDSTVIYLKVKDNIITDVKFETFGCAAAMASSSILTEMVKGKTLEEAFQITEEMVAKELGGLPEHKMHCSLIGVDALKDAIINYQKAGA